MAKSLLVDKFGFDKNGKRTHKKVLASPQETVSKTKPVEVKQETVAPKKAAKPQWYNYLSGLGLTRLPFGIPKEDVKFHADITKPDEYNTKCVMSWIDPKSKRTIMVYTKEFLNRNALVKWDRIKNVNAGVVNEIKVKATDDIVNGSNDKFKQAGAIMSIIANTGLRVGQTKMLEITGNKGVSTMNPEDITIGKDNTITINYVGKSYKENNAIIKGQPELAKYLKKLKASKKDSDRLFDIDRTFVDKVLKNKYGYKDLKIKDMRTYVGTDAAKDHLFSDVDDIKIQLTGDKAKDQKILKNRLQKTYEHVATVLNNTPKMAETAYVHPAVRLSWLKALNINPEELNKGMFTDLISLDDIRKNSTYNQLLEFGLPPINEEWEEECDEFPLFFFEEEEQSEDNLEKGHNMVMKTFTTEDGKTYNKRVRQKIEEDTTKKEPYDVRERKFKNSTLTAQLDRRLTLSFPYDGKFYTEEGKEIIIPKTIMDEYGDVIQKNYYDSSKFKLFRKIDGANESTSVKKEHSQYVKVIGRIKANQERQQQYGEVLDEETGKYRKNTEKRYNEENEKADSVKLLNQVVDSIEPTDSVKRVYDKLVQAKNKLNKDADPDVVVSYKGNKNTIKLSSIIERIKNVVDDPKKSTTLPFGTTFKLEGLNPDNVRYNTIDDLVKFNRNLLENRAKKAYKEKYNEDYNL